MDGNDAASQILEMAALNTRGLHHPQKFLLRRMLADALGKISIAIRIVGKDLSQPWQHLGGVEARSSARSAASGSVAAPDCRRR